MSTLHPDKAPHRIHTVHRFGAAAVGGFLLLFAVVSLVSPVAFMPRESSVLPSAVIVMGLATSGLLAVLSLIVGAALLVAAVRGGPSASTVSLVVGAAFLLSGLVNAMVLDTGYNMLGFRLSNVVFSLAVGLVLLLLGAYGRLTGSLPASSPYADADNENAGDVRSVRDVPRPVDGQVAEALAAAERAVADHTATPAQAAGVAAAHRYHTHLDRSRAFADALDHPSR